MSKFFPILVFLAISLPTSPDKSFIEAEQYYNQGNQFYLEGDYASALERYEHIIGQNVESTSLYLNAGNTCYRLGDIGHAILYWEKVKAIDPGNEAVIHNLNIANTKLIDRIPSLPPDIWTSFWRFSGSFVRPEMLFLVGFIFYLIWVLLLVLKISMKAMSSWYNPVRRISMILAGVAFILSFGNSYISSSDRSAVIISSQSMVRANPAASSPSNRIIHSGLKVEILDTNGLWTKIQLPDGSIGWIESKSVESI